MIPADKFTVGNTITVAIYKKNWKEYFKLSLIAHLWLLIPVYGWARYLAIAAWIGKLSIQELSNNYARLNRKQYLNINSLFILSIIAISSIFIPLILSNIALIPLSIVVPIGFKIILQSPSALDFIENDSNFFLFGYLALFVFYLVWIWIYARLFITELTFADYLTNERIYPYPINRSYSLTKNKTLKIYKIIWLSFLISIPIWIFSCLSVIAVLTFLRLIIPSEQLDTSYLTLPFLPTVLFCAHGLVLPFWQSVKSVTFYHLSKLNNRKNI